VVVDVFPTHSQCRCDLPTRESGRNMLQDSRFLGSQSPRVNAMLPARRHDPYLRPAITRQGPPGPGAGSRWRRWSGSVLQDLVSEGPPRHGGGVAVGRSVHVSDRCERGKDAGDESCRQSTDGPRSGRTISCPGVAPRSSAPSGRSVSRWARVTMGSGPRSPRTRGSLRQHEDKRGPGWQDGNLKRNRPQPHAI
jgi:hypothetical protein